jgi:hypothetical protein
MSGSVGCGVDCHVRELDGGERLARGWSVREGEGEGDDCGSDIFWAQARSAMKEQQRVSYKVGQSHRLLKFI